MTSRRAPLIFVLLCALAGCGDAKPPAGALETVPMKIGAKHFTLEVANTESTREYGLMKRDSMPEDRGMIFVFSDNAVRAFWMKNTRIPLDILFVDAGGQIVTIKQMKPYDLTATRSTAAAKYAIELNQGAANKAGAKVGDRLDIPSIAREPRD